MRAAAVLLLMVAATAAACSPSNDRQAGDGAADSTTVVSAATSTSAPVVATTRTTAPPESLVIPTGLVPPPLPSLQHGYIVGLTDPVGNDRRGPYATIWLRRPDGTVTTLEPPQFVYKVVASAAPGIAYVDFDDGLAGPKALLDVRQGRFIELGEGVWVTGGIVAPSPGDPVPTVIQKAGGREETGRAANLGDLSVVSVPECEDWVVSPNGDDVLVLPTRSPTRFCRSPCASPLVGWQRGACRPRAGQLALHQPASPHVLTRWARRARRPERRQCDRALHR